MPDVASEQTPLLGEDRAASSDLSTKAGEYFILAIDIILFAPCFPIKLVLYCLKGCLDPFSEIEDFIYFWIFFTLPFSALTAFLGIFGPFVLLYTYILVSFTWLRLLAALYELDNGRIIIRTLTVGIILFALLQEDDIRSEFTPTDLPLLSNSSSSIRILDVLPADKRRFIEADLRTVLLENNPAYEALSYEWGAPLKTHSISVRGKRLPVTANLWNALHNIRHETGVRSLWVDAISIDQTNLDEKSSQVLVMSLIYQRARTVVISLGQHTPPRWVQESDPSTWTEAGVVKTADTYWQSTA